MAAVFLFAYAVWATGFSSPDEYLLLTPIALSAAIVAATIEYFCWRDRQLPIVDVGVLCALITLVYVAVPTIFYLKSGLTWTAYSDSRLFQMGATPQEVADVLWMVTAYLAAFCLVYTMARGHGMPGPKVKMNIPPEYGWALLCILLLAISYQFAIERIYGVDLNPSNETALHAGSTQLPLLIGQITHNILGIGRIAKLGLIAFAISRKSWLIAGAVAAWLLIELYSATILMGSRTYVAILFIAALLSVHRMARTVGPLLAVTIAVVFIAGLLAYGYHRDLNLDQDQIADAWSAANEFQILLANAIHLSWAHDQGIIKEVPWALTLSDLIMMIPQQFLPIQKIDPSDWYLRQFGWDGEGFGLMFGVVAQAKLGYGIPEIIARGAILGAVLSFIHRKCVRHSKSLTSFIAYLWLCTSVYYTYRATTFYIATWAVYRLLPFTAIFWYFSHMFATIKGPNYAKPDAGVEPTT